MSAAPKLNIGNTLMAENSDPDEHQPSQFPTNMKMCYIYDLSLPFFLLIFSILAC